MIQSIKYNLDLPEVVIVPISDTHIGASNFSEAKLKETIEEIKKHKNYYVILNGDILDMCIPDSVASYDLMNDNTLSPTTALVLACDLFKPIRDRILLVTEGNHEYRQTKITSISPLMQFCTKLDIADRYRPNGSVLFIRLLQRANTKRVFSIYVTHGSSNSSVVGGKIKKLQDMSQIIDADVYIVGHSHLPACFKQDFFRTNAERCLVVSSTKLFVNSSAYLYYDGYGQRKNYVPQAIAQPKILLQLKRIQNKVNDNTIKQMSCLL